ncbi:unnamed protein product [Trifolium pratense]|uniref:Uncharacterized protein n=1 Tax=Trifolium pratense TaxID=57577 RepID=A0ACB0I9B1_TRIPR|nr:unnamed protein product [Trifolium pratense]
MFGSCKKITISKDDTVILDGAGDKKAIEERCEQIRSTVENSTSDYDKEKLQERLAKLSGGVRDDKASIQNVINTTRILINPDIPEVEAFKNRERALPSIQMRWSAFTVMQRSWCCEHVL